MTKENKGVVTAPTEPLKLTPQAMTLEEALAAVRAKAKADGPTYRVTEIRFMPFAHYPWWVEMAYGDVKVYADWPPALSFALGVPVAARDDAAELRAALEGLVPVALALTDLAVSGFDLPPGTVTAIAKARAALDAAEGSES